MRPPLCGGIVIAPAAAQTADLWIRSGVGGAVLRWLILEKEPKAAGGEMLLCLTMFQPPVDRALFG